MSTPLIAARAVSFGYDDRVVVDRLDLSVGVGEVVALLGPNGSGKSTLVKGLFGLVPRLGGTIEVEERSETRRPTMRASAMCRNGIRSPNRSARP